MAQDGIIGKNTLDETLYSQNNAYHRSTRGDETSKFRVNSIVNRDKLITDDRVDIGHIIYFDNGTIGSFPRGHYVLEEYPTYGSVTGVVWKSISATEAVLKLSYFAPTTRQNSDATYLDVTLSGNTLSSPSVPFTADDVGKTIAIKKAHQNPDTADGSEFLETQLGRLVTATVTIQSVDVANQTAVISETLNQTGQLRAFLFYNYLDDYVGAINSCYELGVSKLEIDVPGIVGLSLFEAAHTEKYILIKSATGDLNVYPKKGGKTTFKWVNEHITYQDSMYRVEPGNGDFYHSVNILPPDEGTTVFGFAWNILMDTSDAGQHQSVRTLQIENVKFSSDDLDGNDGRWGAIVELSSGGNDEIFELSKVEYQTINIKNCAPRCKNDGITIFNNLSPDLVNFSGNNNIRIEDVDLRYWSSNYEEENGRAWIDNDTIENCNDDNVKFKFGVNPNDTTTSALSPLTLTAVGGILTVNTPDFSWYDYRLFMAASLGRDWRVALINDQNQEVVTKIPKGNPNLTYLNSAKILDTSGFDDPVPDGTYKAMEIRALQGQKYYGHPTYIHPHQNITGINFKSDKDLCWWNSGSYKRNPLRNKWIKLYRCDINVLSVTNGGGGMDTNIYLDSCKFITSTQFFANELHCYNTEVPEVDGVIEIYTQGEVDFKGNIKCYNLNQTEFRWSNVTLSSNIWFYNNPVTFHLTDFKFIAALGNIHTLDGSTIIYERMRRDSKMPGHFGSLSVDSPPVLNPNSKVIWKDCLPDAEGIWDLQGHLDNNHTLKGNIEFINSTFPLGTFDGHNGEIVDVQMPVNKMSGNSYDTIIWPHGTGAQIGMIQGFKYFTADFTKSDSFNLLDENHALFRPQAAKDYSSWHWRDGGYDVLGWWKGDVFMKVTTDTPFDTLQSWVGRNNIYTNVRLKGLKREIGEVIRFSIDYENGILFEEDSTHSTKKVTALPSEGIGGEQVDFNGVNYRYNVALNEVTDELSTIVLSNEDMSYGLNTIDGIGFNTGEFYTIGQDLYERGYRDFSFSLILDDDTELPFIPRQQGWAINGIHDRHLWLFQTILPNGTPMYASVDCKTGDFKFTLVTFVEQPQSTTPIATRIDNWGYTLKSTNNFKLTATKVVSKAWEEYTVLVANPNGNPLLFFNELGNPEFPSNIQPFTVFIDGVNGNDSTGQLTNKSNPFKTFAAANAAVTALNPATGDGWTYEYMGNGITYYLDKAPKCNIKHYASGYDVVFDFSNATGAIYEHGGATKINFIIDNKNGELIFNKSFSGGGGDGGTNSSQLLNLTIDVDRVVVSSVDPSSLFSCSGHLEVNVKDQLTVNSGYFLNNGNMPDTSYAYVYINRSVGAGITLNSGIFQYVRYGDIKLNYMENIAISYQLAGADFTIGDMHDSSVVNTPIVQSVTAPTSVTFVNSYLYNSRIFPKCDESYVLSGTIRDLVMVSGGINPHASSIGSELKFDHLTIHRVRWSDNSLTRNGNLLTDSYSGVNFSLTNLTILDCQLGFALFQGYTQSQWDNNQGVAMNWFGTITINATGSAPAFRIRNIGSVADRYAKVNLYGTVNLNSTDGISYPGAGNDYARNIELTKMTQY